MAGAARRCSPPGRAPPRPARTVPWSVVTVPAADPQHPGALVDGDAAAARPPRPGRGPARPGAAPRSPGCTSPPSTPDAPHDRPARLRGARATSPPDGLGPAQLGRRSGPARPCRPWRSGSRCPRRSATRPTSSTASGQGAVHGAPPGPRRSGGPASPSGPGTARSTSRRCGPDAPKPQYSASSTTIRRPGRAGPGSTPSTARCSRRRRSPRRRVRSPGSGGRGVDRAERRPARRTAQSRVHASVSTVRRICSISANCSSPADQRRRELDHRVAAVVGAAVEARLEQRLRQEAAQQPLRLVLVERLLGGLVLDQLDAEEVAVAADVADDRQVVEPFQVGPEQRGVVADVAVEVLALDDVQVGQRHRRADRVAAEGDAVREPVGRPRGTARPAGPTRSSRRAARNRGSGPWRTVMMSGV